MGLRGSKKKSKSTLDAKKPTEKASGEKKNKVDRFQMGEKIALDSFDLMRVVGKGSFGKVYQVRLKETGDIYALKVLKKSHLAKRKQIGHTRTERKVLQNIEHPFIVSLRYAFQTEQRLYMVLDYFTGGELFFHLKNGGRFDYARGRFYCAELTCALECLHDNDIIYRDLKPENVLLDNEGHVRLTDFGLSKDSVAGNTLTHTFCGTPEYLAPEVIQGKPYNKTVDWWSLGTMTYEMICGLPPFYSTNVHKMYTKIIMEQLKFPKHLPKVAVDFLAKLLDRNPKSRLGIGGGKEVKAHDFFESIDFAKLLRKEIEPPFKPRHEKEGKEDVTNVEEDFLTELPKETPMGHNSVLDQSVKNAFNGFTFNEKGVLGGMK
ncbi:hypothetical protein AAMO2058_000889600 [Amorphochlora amoebiformis]|mmetsp:Transcript_4409/g.6695  ORF Transcript_4409/g.6695 Transcript_4409/m.6695 type:complete len:376 (-) Transcript_4409:226-1353(-)